MTALFFAGDGEAGSESGAASNETNCAPFIIRWHPGTQRGRGKESRRSRVRRGGRGASAAGRRRPGGVARVVGGGETGAVFGPTLRLMEWVARWVWTPGE